MSTVGGVRGDLLRWAREQQGLTMRWIHNNGGPSAAYQCEVEKGKKREVLSGMLASWIALLNVSEAFARGQIGKYHVDPSTCRGMAADIGELVTSGRADWSPLTERERVREVLRLVARHSKNLPRVVLAWVLDLPLDTLDALLAGHHPVLKPHFEAVVHLTTLPLTFFAYGTTSRFEEYLPVFQRALELGLAPEAVLSLMAQLPGPPSSRSGRHGLDNNGPLRPGGGA